LYKIVARYETVTVPGPTRRLPEACRERDDAVFLHLAIASRAELLVSGDSDLTVLADAYRVASPETLRNLLGIESG